MVTAGLKFVDEEATGATPLLPSPATSGIADTPLPNATRRYDQAAIEKALTLASQLQQQHKATLMAEQVVRIGEEVNVEPVFVLQALALLEANDAGATAAGGASVRSAAQNAARKKTQHMSDGLHQLRRLSLRARTVAFVVPALYTLLALFAFHNNAVENGAGDLGLWLAFVGAPLLALCLGGKLRSKRLGLMSGFLIGLGVILAAARGHGGGDQIMELVLYSAAFSISGAALGVVGAVTRKHGPRLYHRSLAASLRRFPGIEDA